MKTQSGGMALDATADAELIALIDRYEAARRRELKTPPGALTQAVIRDADRARLVLSAALAARRVTARRGEYAYASDGRGDLYRFRTGKAARHLRGREPGAEGGAA